MNQNDKDYVTAPEVAEILGVSVGQAYKTIRQLNQELIDNHFSIVPGRVSKEYFEKKFYGYHA